MDSPRSCKSAYGKHEENAAANSQQILIYVKIVNDCRSDARNQELRVNHVQKFQCYIDNISKIKKILECY